MVAWHLAQELMKRGKKVELLFLMELNLKKQYEHRVALFYGEKSTTHNPYLIEDNPDEIWQKIYPAYTVDFIKGEQGKYFEHKNIREFARKISNSLAEV